MPLSTHRPKNEKKPIISCTKSLIQSEQFVTFWGTRGTIPTPNEDMLKYGGNTPCVEVFSNSNTKRTSIILDAGTGIIKCCENAVLRGDRSFHLLLTHMHYDHIIGLTKFIPFFRKDCKIHVYGQAKIGCTLKEIIQKFFSSPFFPIEFHQLPAVENIEFHELNSKSEFFIEDVLVEFLPLNHPQEAVAYKIWSEDKISSVVYATDHEHGTQKDNELEKFIKNSDLFIYDSTFSDSNYKNFIGWGHSTAKQGAIFAQKTGVKFYAIFHHDPSSTDDFLESKILIEARSFFKNSFLAAEHQTLNISELKVLLTE